MVSIACLCAKITQQVHLEPTNKLLKFCHYTARQTVSGQICTSSYSFQEEPKLQTLAKYQQSDALSRYFVGPAVPICLPIPITERFFVASELIDCPPQSKYVQQRAVKDTHDGGLSFFLPGDATESDVPCWVPEPRKSIQKIERAS